MLALCLFLFSTGHHATWIYPKSYIRPPSGNIGGLIPDYLLSGECSDGRTWWFLELKGANENAFIKKGKRVYLSGTSNKGVCQLINYIDFCDRSQTYLRDELKLKGIRRPTGLLLLGTETETEDEQKKDFKKAWNMINPNIRIRSYSALVKLAEEKIQGNKE